MRFGPTRTLEAAGAILAHSLSVAGGRIKKGRVLTDDDVRRLIAAGHDEVMTARLGPDDIGEDAAADRVAAAVAGPGTTRAAPFTGRANIFAQEAGLAILDTARISALNAIDESVTLATLAPFERVTAGQMIATVKVITFAVAADVVASAEAAATGAVRVAPFRPMRAGLILTAFDDTKPSIVDKRAGVMADRLASLGGTIETTERVAHAVPALAAALREFSHRAVDPILVFSASAIVDRGDVLPAAVVAAGGVVDRIGMPVDPGNLAMIGQIGDVPVVGVPSCAASPKLNGFDWILERLAAGVDVSSGAIAAMGVGGLLKEISSRPQPRDREPDPEPRRAPRVAAIVLAAGRSSRMGADRHKLLEPLGDQPLVRHAVTATLAAVTGPVVVVTGHRANEVSAALDGLPVQFVENPRFADGLATSIVAGIAALPRDVDAAFVTLGDMPLVRADDLARMVAAFSPSDGRTIVVPVHAGKRGNPILWGRMHFPALGTLTGDSGARHLLGNNRESVTEIEIDSDRIFVDVDTPDALAALTRRPS
jgi:molybdenum cofactor cytidylyltransferase